MTDLAPDGGDTPRAPGPRETLDQLHIAIDNERQDRVRTHEENLRRVQTLTGLVRDLLRQCRTKDASLRFLRSRLLRAEGGRDLLQQQVSFLEVEVAVARERLRQLTGELSLRDRLILQLEEFVNILKERTRGGANSSTKEREVMNKCLSPAAAAIAVVTALLAAGLWDRYAGFLTLLAGEGAGWWVAAVIVALVTLALLVLFSCLGGLAWANKHRHWGPEADLKALGDAEKELQTAADDVVSLEEAINGNPAGATPEAVKGVRKLLLEKQGEHLTLTADLGVLSAAGQTLSSQLATLAAQLSHHEGLLTNLYAEVDALEAATPPNAAAITAKEAEVTAKEAEVAAKRAAVEAKTAEVTAKMAEIKAKTDAIDAKRAEVGALHTQLHGAGGLLDQLADAEAHKAQKRGDAEAAEQKVDAKRLYLWQVVKFAGIVLVVMLWWDLFNVNDMVRQSQLSRGEEPGAFASAHMPAKPLIRPIWVHNHQEFQLGDSIIVTKVGEKIVVRANVTRTDGKPLNQFEFYTSLFPGDPQGKR